MAAKRAVAKPQTRAPSADTKPRRPRRRVIIMDFPILFDLHGMARDILRSHGVQAGTSDYATPEALMAALKTYELGRELWNIHTGSFHELEIVPDFLTLLKELENLGGWNVVVTCDNYGFRGFSNHRLQSLCESQFQKHGLRVPRVCFINAQSDPVHGVFFPPGGAPVGEPTSRILAYYRFNAVLAVLNRTRDAILAAPEGKPAIIYSQGEPWNQEPLRRDPMWVYSGGDFYPQIGWSTSPAAVANMVRRDLGLI